MCAERDGGSLKAVPGCFTRDCCRNRVRFEWQADNKERTARRSNVRFPELPVRLGPTAAKNTSRRQLALYDRLGFILTRRS